jgi:hypothetical protein
MTRIWMTAGVAALGLALAIGCGSTETSPGGTGGAGGGTSSNSGDLYGNPCASDDECVTDFCNSQGQCE